MKLQRDKVLHFCVCLILCLIAGVLTTPANDKLKVTLLNSGDYKINYSL